MAEHLFKDTFEVTGIDPDGKKFDKVTRIQATSENEMEMQLDVNNELYPMLKGDKFNMVLARTLNLDGSTDTGPSTHRLEEKRLLTIMITSCMESFTRSQKVPKTVMAIHLLKYLHGDQILPGFVEMEIYASFGGLLMMLRGDPSSAASFQLDQRLFLLINKVLKD